MVHIIFRLKYPKLMLLLLTFVLAYFIFAERNFAPLHSFLLSLGYLGTFISGFLFSYGFTAAPATALLLIISRTQNIFLASFVAALGCTLGTLVIFKFIRTSMMDEIKGLENEKFLFKIREWEKLHISKKINHYIIIAMSGFIIASPLPNEIGVSMLAATEHLSVKLFSAISFILSFLGIFVIMFIASIL